ncbi:MAG: hypothetical protein ACXWKX_08375 [Caulobacteraceae bacterium]
MDAGSQRRERLLEFDIDRLQEALGAQGGLFDVDFQIQTHQHSGRMEAYVSQADFALVLEFRNTVVPHTNWDAAYLMQAKRLFPLATGEYSVYSTFTSADAAQQKRIRSLAGILGEEAIQYCLYCPPTSGYDPGSAAAIRALHAQALSAQIYDYAVGLALHEEIKRAAGFETGMWIVNTQNEPPNAADLHRRALGGARPLTWFLLQHFDKRGRLSADLRSTGTSANPPRSRVRAIAEGESVAIRSLIEDLGTDARKDDLDPATIKVLPASTVTIRIRVGPAEGVDLPASPAEA